MGPWLQSVYEKRIRRDLVKSHSEAPLYPSDYLNKTGPSSHGRGYRRIVGEIINLLRLLQPNRYTKGESLPLIIQYSLSHESTRAEAEGLMEPSKVVGD